MNSAFTAQVEAAVQSAADLLRNCHYGVALTGAGLSTPSGIPDFRSEGTGLWARDEPLEVASLDTFRVAPEKFFRWFHPLARQIFEAQPNAAHVALANLENAGRIHAIITQNIDVLHQKAGSQSVIEVHGSLRTLTCTQCYHQEDSRAHLQAFVESGLGPRCPRCGSVMKPDVILFGEQIPQEAWSAAQREMLRCDVVLVAGSSLEVLPVAGLPMQAVDRGAHLIIVNQSPTYLGVRADVVIMEDVEKILPAIAGKVING